MISTDEIVAAADRLPTMPHPERVDFHAVEAHADVWAEELLQTVDPHGDLDRTLPSLRLLVVRAARLSWANGLQVGVLAERGERS